MSEVEGLVARGMARQLAAFRAAVASGMPRAGWKVGLNVAAVQQRLGLSGPVVGWLDGRRVVRAGDSYAPRPESLPRFEAEAAIFVSGDVAAGASLDECRAAIRGVAPAFEFVDGTKPLTPLDEMLAHNILHDGVMLGPEHPVEAALGLAEHGLPRVTVNGELRTTGLPGRYPEDLAEVVKSVADFLATHGEQLKAGDVIIGGSYIDPFDLASRDVVEADFGSLGTLSVRVA